MRKAAAFALIGLVLAPRHEAATAKPVLHGRRWVAITGKPLAATAGATMFQKGGNAVDAACAMLAATATMWDSLSWGGETQALVFDPRSKKVVALNALGTGYIPDQSVIMAGALLGTLPLLIAFLLFGKQIVGGIMQGAIKG